MLSKKTAVAAFTAATVGLVLTSSAFGRVTPLDTNYLTFSGPVALPGVTLTRGTYIFERLEPGSSIVRVASRDRSKTYLLAFTHRVDRPRGMSTDVALVLGEAQRGEPVPVQSWFPLGETRGHEFIYPK
jgi:hypothetical protein